MEIVPKNGTMVIGNDGMGSYKSNYHTIIGTTVAL